MLIVINLFLWQDLGVDCEIVGACEKKAEAMKMQKLRRVKAMVVFKDVKELIAGLVTGEFIEIDLKSLKGNPIDLMAAGSPCPPFSTKWKKRFEEGACQNHPLFQCLMDLIKLAEVYDPHSIMVEEVGGMVKASEIDTESDDNATPSAAQHFLNLLRQRCPTETVFLDTNVWFQFCRERLLCM